MQFDLSEEQQILKDTLERLMLREYRFEDRRRHLGEPEGWSRDLWRRLAELGVLGMTFAEADGGLGGGAVETMIVMEAMGRALALEPYLGAILLCGGALGQGGTPAQRAAWLPRLAGGEALLAFAHGEAGARYQPLHVETTAQPVAEGHRLSGTKTLVLGAEAADAFVVSARPVGDGDAVCLFLVDARAPGVEVRGHRLHDGRSAGEVALDDVLVPSRDALAGGGDCRGLLLQLQEAALAAVCAEAVGAMQAAFELTVEYLKTRQQFGRPIGTFQVLRHRAADMLVAIEEARSMALYATMMLGDRDETARRQALSSAKIQINRSARFVGQQTVQLHGAVGMTAEHPASHYLKRLALIEMELGDTDHHAAALAGLGSLPDEPA